MSAIILNPRFGFNVGPRIALLGDSMQDTAFVDAAAERRYRNYAFPSWVRFLTKQRVSIPFELNFAHSGDTLQQIAVRTGACISARPDAIIFNGGTNNAANAANTFAVMRDVFVQQILLPITAAQIPLIITPISPRPIAGVAANQMIVINQFNNFLRELCLGENNAALLALYNPSFRSSLLRFADPTPYWCNYADANGDPLANYLRDTVHANAQGAYWYGKSVADVFNAMLPPLGTQIDHPANYFNLSNNPRGNLIRSGTVNQGLLAGTAGTNTPSGGFSFTGVNIATGWTVSRPTGTSTVVANCTKENPRTDGPNSGERQLIVLTGSTTGLASEIVQFRWTPSFAIGGGDIQIGDNLVGELGIELVSQINLQALELVWNEFGGAQTRNVADMSFDATPGSDVYTSVAHSGIARTPSAVPYADSTNIAFKLNMYFKTDVSALALSIKVSDAKFFKVQ